MRDVIVSDTSCLILLDKMQELELLKLLYRKVLITPVIADEFGKDLPHWIEVRSAVDKSFEALLAASIDKGEATAIALAVELHDPLLVLDDDKARRFAKSLNIRLTGTVGVLTSAYEARLIPDLEEAFKKLRLTNFRVHPQILQKILDTLKKK